MEHKKIVIIGGGPGGYEAAQEAVRLGAEVILVEKNKLGGTCLHCGCIPTKTLQKEAEVLKLLKNIDKYGIKISDYIMDYSKVVERKNEVIEKLHKAMIQNMKKKNVRIIYGIASFIDNKTIEVQEESGQKEKLRADYIIIASGSSPVIPDLVGVTSKSILTSKGLLELENIPKELVIVGGGVVGMELACIFNEFGSKITVIEFMKSILISIDDSISKRFKSFCKNQGIKIITSSKVNEINEVDNSVSLKYSDTKGEYEIKCDRVLFSVGRKGCIDNLGLDNTDIKHNEKFIEVDEKYETSQRNIYAIGDVNGKSMLAHSASNQGIQVIRYILKGIEIKGTVIPSSIFTFPEISTVGITEQQAKECGIKYKVSKSLFSANGKANAIGETDGFVKVIAKEDNTIIGVHIIGPHASDIIHEGVLAVEQNLTTDIIGNIIHVHPTLAESFGEAAKGISALEI